MRILSWAVVLAVTLAAAPVAFVVVARNQVGEVRPVGAVCDFEHDPGSGRSADGRIEHRGWLVRREVCVHATDGENEEPVGVAPFVAAVVAPVPVGALLGSLVAWRSGRRRSGG